MHRSALATLTILTALSAWNEFFWPFLVGRSESVRVMAVAINAFRQQQAGGTPDWSGLMACTVLGIVPIAVLVVFFGRRVVESFQYTGPKWDQNQPPAYRACADAFEKQNPDIRIKITQTGWFDYWNALSAAFVLGTAPDVITDHLARYPEFVQNNLLVDLGPLITRDKVATDIYFGGLVKVWGKEGKQYGLPKDWDTIAIVYNKEMLQKAGIDPKSLSDLDWNPKDGGSFGRLIAQLSVDASGKQGSMPVSILKMSNNMGC
ncbi:MAG TPA: extracellular solute-binding protein [Chthoniobacterales bacterium]|nr:extracellular solute-binding protein [Chthoniobacterales bacterium]